MTAKLLTEYCGSENKALNNFFIKIGFVRMIKLDKREFLTRSFSLLWFLFWQAEQRNFSTTLRSAISRKIWKMALCFHPTLLQSLILVYDQNQFLVVMCCRDSFSQLLPNFNDNWQALSNSNKQQSYLVRATNPWVSW